MSIKNNRTENIIVEKAAVPSDESVLLALLCECIAEICTEAEKPVSA
jgi:hypothetical protein